MSRRKQSKPRAVKCDENDEEMTEIELEKKATEIMEEDGLKSDHEEEEDLKDEQNENIELEIEENNKNDGTAESEKNHNETLSSGSKEIIDNYDKNLSNNLSIEIEIKEETILDTNNYDNNENKNQIDEDTFNMDSEKEQDENLDELMSSQDDLNSSDSFYSDYYSTHTSLSYSPSSISEEATTANSIHRFYTPEPRPEGEGNVMENLTDSNIFKGDEVIAPTAKKRQTRNSDAKAQPPQKLRKIDKNLDPTKNGCDNSKNSLESSYQCQFCEKSFPRLGYLKKHEQSHAEHLPFKCEYCARLFKHKRSRDRHTKLHTGDRRYKCPHCEAAFSRSDHLKIHMKTHDNQKPFQCTVCNRGYNTAAALTSHMQNHKKQKNLLTKDGRESYSPESTGSASSNKYIQQKNKYKYGTHMTPSPLASDQIHNHKNIQNESKNNKFYCVYCTKSDFGSVEQLNTHVQQIHHNVIYNTGIRDLFKVPQSHPNVPLNCEFCSMKFANIPTMFQHIQNAHKDKIFNRTLFANEFNRHLELEKSESHILTPRSVEEFHKMSKFNEGTVNMDKHGQRSASLPSVSEQKDEEQNLPTDLSQPDKRSQSPKNCGGKDNVGMFLCNQCNAALPDFNTFCNHLKTHINTYGVNLTCPQCGLNLHDSDEMDRHYTSHFLACTSVFLCDMNCKKTFKTCEELQNHLFDAHAQVMYKCSICLDLFNSKSAVQIHFSTTHFIEKKIYQCSACKETFDYEKELLNHIKTRHQIQSGSIQCMFCRVICKSELEMHFHLAEHSRQFRCPNCPETFHVEFLLDRHIKTQHLSKDQMENGGPSTPTSSEMNGLYYKVGCRPGPGNPENNLSPNANNLKMNMNAKKHSNLLYDMSQAYFDPNKSLLLNRIYNYNSERSSFPPDHNSYRNFFIRPEFFAQTPYKDVPRHPYPNEDKNKKIEPTVIGFSCGICDRNDFKNEVEVHSHRKIAHNFKTGVSLRCAYCNDVFKSRTELENHMKNCHNSTGKHKCLICDEIFPSPAILAEHKLQHSKVGQSGVCSYCYMPLNDFSVFKIHMTEHNIEGQIPAECICCRQTLNSDFEIGLHAKFHTKTSEVAEGNECALCLVAIPITSETRICEKCRKKHNLSFKLNKVCYENTHQFQNENHCNLCKTVFPTYQRLREHLVEHTFYGCEDRGYTCYICSAVFVAPALLLSHINKHGHESKPYDCNLCIEKFFFRAELDNHRIEHENRKEDSNNFRIELKELKTENKDGSSNSSLNSNSHQEINTADREGKNDIKEIAIVEEMQSKIEDIKNDIKTEKTDEIENDDEYIEVEKVMESKLNEGNAELDRKLE